jgi:hypothetical protein
VKGKQMEDREVEEWARLILSEAQKLVDLLGEADDSRHLLRPSDKSGVLVDQWTQPPLFTNGKNPTESIALDDRRLELRAEVQALEPRLKQAYILVSGMRRGVEKQHDRWRGE